MGDGRDKKVTAEGVVGGQVNERNLEPGKSAPTDQHANTAGAPQPQQGAPRGILGDKREDCEHTLQLEISKVDNVFQGAADRIRVENLIRPEMATPALITAALDMLTLHFGSLVVEGFTAFRAHAIQQAFVLQRQLPKGYTPAIAQLSPEAMRQLVGVAMTVGKATVASLHPSISEDKANVDQFLKDMKQGTAIALQELWKTLPKYCTDEELLAYVEAFNVKYHPQGVYEDLLRDLVQRFSATVPKIGRSQVPPGINNPPQAWVDHKNPKYMDVRLSWAKFASGYTRKLMYEYLPFHSMEDQTKSIAHKMDDRPFETGLPEDNGKKYKFVDEDLTFVALTRHKLVWGADPIEVEVDDSTWYWDPPRAQAAQSRKQGVPRLQLGQAQAQTQAPSWQDVQGWVGPKQ